MLSMSLYLAAQEDYPGHEDIKHQVKPLETFYSISKEYGITIDEIKRANPGVDYPKAGMMLIIPGVKSKLVSSEPEFVFYTTNEAAGIYNLARVLRHPVDSLKKWNPGITSYLSAGTEIKAIPTDPDIETITHTVIDERSSLRDLGQLYEVPYRTLKQYNRQIRNRVWFGQKVNIPVIKQDTGPFDEIILKGMIPEESDEEADVIEDISRCMKDPRNLTRQYKVALMIPLGLENAGAIDTLMTGTPSELMDHPSFRFIQFYQGFLMAAERLAFQGLKVDLKVIDVDQDVSKIEETIRHPELKEMDVIIGPFYKNSFSVAADFARTHDIPIVNPLSSRDDIIQGNPSVIKVLPSRTSQIQELASLIKYRFLDYNLVVVRENKYQGSDFIQAMKGHLNKTLSLDVPEVDYMTDSINGVKSYLSDSCPNLVIIYSEREVLPMEILPLLNELKKEYEIKIIGLPEWSEFEHLENKYLISLEAYLFSNSFIDYYEMDVKRFAEDFRTSYLAEPLEYAFDGYDIAQYFLSMIMDYGRDFPECLHQVNYPLLHTRYQFKKIPGGGYINDHWNIFHFMGYSLIPVPDLR
jgi:hypothetical protein